MRRLVFAVSVAVILSGGLGSAQSAPVLGIQGDHFTVNGEPKFLLFISYFDAMRRANNNSMANAEIDDDLAYFKSKGFDGIRIFPNWWLYSCAATRESDTLFTGGTSLRTGKLGVFLHVLDRAAANGLLVDVSFTRETVPDLGEDNPSSGDIDDYKEQIRKVTEELEGDYPHVFFDLQNEYENDDSELTDADIDEIATAIRAEDAQRILMASRGSDPGDPYDEGVVVATAALDVAAVHPPRSSATWYTNTEIADAIADARAGMAHGGIAAPYRPVYLQEPRPFLPFAACDQNFDSNRDHHEEAAANAKENGAAAYTFHTRLSFDLASAKYVSQLAGDEEALVESLYDEVRPSSWGATLAFTDSTLTVGTTVAKRVHITELRQRVDMQRVRFNLSPYTWTDSSPVVGYTPIKALHISELRTALGQAYTAASETPPTYTDSTITAQSTAIKAVHITQLRSAVEYLEQQ